MRIWGVLLVFFPLGSGETIFKRVFCLCRAFKITSLPSFLPLSILFVQNYVPTVFENYTASFEIDTQRIELSLWDTSGKRVTGPRGA